MSREKTSVIFTNEFSLLNPLFVELPLVPSRRKKETKRRSIKIKIEIAERSQKEESISGEESDRDTGETSGDTSSSVYRPRRGSLQAAVTKQNYGSFYLRMGAVGMKINVRFKRSRVSFAIKSSFFSYSQLSASAVWSSLLSQISINPMKSWCMLKTLLNFSIIKWFPLLL